MDARNVILERIRSALGENPGASTPSCEADWASIERHYDHVGRLAEEQKLELFEDRLRDYDADVSGVSSRRIPSAIAAVLRERGIAKMLVPSGFPSEWLPTDATLTEDRGFTAHQLDTFDGVLTTATLAIAETGTLVLQNVPGQGRRAATLVPDFHLCVVRARDVVQNVPEAFARLAASATLPTTFVSGPSATADIEMTRIKGVHGPRFLHVLIVTEDAPGISSSPNDSTAAGNEEQWQ